MSKMNDNIAYVIGTIESLTGQPPVKKMLQKIVYLLEEKGVDLNCNYTLHFYGPYSARLDAKTLELSSEGAIAFDYSGYGHKMSIEQNYEVEPSLTKDELTIIESVISRYKEKTPSDLELLTTTIYAKKYTDAKSKDDIINNVKIIKGNKYPDTEIEWAIKEFPYFGIEI